MINYSTVFNCCACGQYIDDRQRVLDLGYQPLANNFTGPEPQQTFPLRLMYCSKCYHLQLSHTVDPAALFSHYKYVSGTSETLRAFFDSFAQKLLQRVKQPKVIFDVASNDGSQLLAFKKYAPAAKLVGIDPAKNLVADYDQKGLTAVCDFFGTTTCSAALGDMKADIITMQNVVAHTPNPRLLLTEAANRLAPRGIIVVQVSQSDMLKTGQFDTIYHEHFSYFNDYSMMCLAEQAKLAIVATWVEPVHGNSTVYVLRKSQPAGTRDFLSNNSKEELRKFNSDAKSKIASMRAFNSGTERDLIGIGAAAKSSVCIHAAQLYGLRAVLDESPLKVGNYVPGTRIQVKHMREIGYVDRPTDAIVFAWNFLPEIKKKVYAHEAARKHVRLITFFPSIEIHEAD